MAGLFLLTLGLSTTAIHGEVEKPIWAKGAVVIGGCDQDAGRRIPSKDGSVIIELRCHPTNGDKDPVPYLRVRTATGAWHEIELDQGSHESAVVARFQGVPR